jgi:pyridoxamine 5'-phosphate oxidase
MVSPMSVFDPDPHDPVAAFLALREEARAHGEPWDATGCVLATAGPDGQPHARYVLVKEASAEGFFFFTNYESDKARELDANPLASLCFHFDRIGVQVRVEGSAARTSASVSEAYFAERPRGSQLGAWASAQSRPLESRQALLDRVEALGREHPETVPRPAHWGGFRLQPTRIELWREGEFRLHDRFAYVRHGDGWTRTRLNP